jgi:flagellar basal body-associated protein FliL
MTQETPQSAPATPTPAAPRPNPVVTISVVVGALALGAAVGALAIGPRLVSARTPAHADESAEESAGEASEHGGGGHGKGGASQRRPVLRMDNFVVNPAGSMGQHFLMVSVAVEVKDAKVEESLRERESEIRDIVVSHLESLTMQDLAAAGVRDRIKASLLQSIAPMAGKSSLRIYLPQFVVQ